MLLDIDEGRWDPETLRPARSRPGSLPEPLGSADVYGVSGEFGGEVPVAGIAGDQQAALFGQACHAPGDAKNTYGTGSFVLLNSRRRAAPPPRGPAQHDRLGATGDDGLRAGGGRLRRRSRGAVAARRARADRAAPPRPRPSPDRFEGNDGVYFVPALTGLGSPYWDPYARGTLVGLTRGTGSAPTSPARRWRRIAYQTVDAVRAQEAASGERLTALRADGGAVANGWLMQFQADVLGAPVVRPRDRRDDGARRGLPGRYRHRSLGPRSGRGDVASAGRLRAAHERPTNASP